MQTDPVKSGGENDAGRQDPPRRRFSDGPMANAENLMAAAGPFSDELNPHTQQRDPPRRRFSDGPLNRAETMMNQAGGFCETALSQPQLGNSGPRRRRSDGHLDQAEAMMAAASDPYDQEPDPQGSGAQRKAPRRRRSDGPLDQAQAMLSAAGDGFGAIEPIPHGQFPNQPGSAPPSTQAPRRRANSDGIMANAEALLAAGFGPDDLPDAIEPLPHSAQPQLSQQQSRGQRGGSDLQRQGRQQLRRSNSDGVINQAEALMAAAAGYNDEPDPQQQFNLQRQGSQMPKRRYSDGPMASAEALLAAGMFEPDDDDQKPPSGRGGGGHRRRYSDDPTSNAEALLAASYEPEGASSGGGGGGSSAGNQVDVDNLGVEGQLQQLTMMQQMALQGLLTPHQMAALHNLQVQLHLQHSGFGMASMSAQQPAKVKSAMKSGSSMSPGPTQQPQQQQQGFDLSGFEPTSIQDMVARDSGASPVQSSQPPPAGGGSSMAGMDGGMATGGMAVAMSGGGVGIMAQKRDAIEAGKDMGVKSASCSSSKKKTWKKPKDKPKRPLSAYNLFFQKERERMVQEAKAADAAAIAAGLKDPNKIERNPSGRRSRKIHGIGFASMAQSIAAKWKALEASEKKEFEERAAVERARYRKELDEWKKVKREKTLIQQRAELREIQERRRMEEQAALAAQQGGQMAFQFAQIQQMGGQQQMAFQQMMAQQQQQQMGVSMNPAGTAQAQMMQAQQMSRQQMPGQQIPGQQMPGQMRGQQMPAVDESDFYLSMFEHLSRDDAGNIGNATAAAIASASGAASSHANQSQGASAPTPPPMTVQVASNAPAEAKPPAADRVVSQGMQNHSSAVGNRHEMEKMLMQQPEDVHMCSFQMSDLSLDLANQDPALRQRR